MIEELQAAVYTNECTNKPDKPITEEEDKERVIKLATLDTTNLDKGKTVLSVRVTNITSNGGDFVFEADYKPYPDVDGVSVTIPRDLMKKLIYDIYLK